MAYKVEIHPAAQKQMLSLPKAVQVEVALSIDHLGNTPRPPRVKKLSDSGLWRIRIGHFRVVYSINDEASLVLVVRVVRRQEDTYRRL